MVTQVIPTSTLGRGIVYRQSIQAVESAMSYRKHYRKERSTSQDLAGALLDLLRSAATHLASTGRWTVGAEALPLVFPALLLRGDNRIDGHVEDAVHAPHLFAAAFDVRGVHSLRNGLALLWRHRREALGLEELDARPLISQVALQPHEDDGRCWTEVENLGVPLSGLDRCICRIEYDTYLVHHILQRSRTVDGKAHKQEICLRIGERAQSVVLFLASSIPEGQLDGFPGWAVDGLRDVVFEHGWDVFLDRQHLFLVFVYRQIPTSGKYPCE